MNENDFDPIIYLGLESLNQAQITNLRPQLYNDIAGYIVSRFVDSLSEDQIEQIEPQLSAINNYQTLISVILQIQPEFESEKIRYLEDYRQQFKLQNFIDFIK